ncbi:MAG TPA: filamentous hemagglutinin [Cyanobacteria bacterium UBA8803]|nr:filamentous hemagglutinin [Cyanobacteria bacterium UBA8803]
MKAFSTFSSFRFFVGIASYWLAVTSSVQAQSIVPDNTLPSNSVVTPNGNTLTITGGTTVGSNLFHSFRTFSVTTGDTAWLNNDTEIRNILTRVTGNSISNIDGLILTNGTANLFLINPNGIIFGANASLNIGGSFIGSTARSIRLADGNEFSATNPQAPPLLTINVPIGLQLGANPAGIVVQGGGNNLKIEVVSSAFIRDNRTVGLQVAPGQTLALVGGDIALEGGNLTAEGGQIELWSVRNGLLGITNSQGKLAITNEQLATQFGDILFTGAASADASGNGGGTIQVQGQRIWLRDGSAILATTLGAGHGGEITVRAAESLEVLGFDRILLFPSIISTSSQPGSIGTAGAIAIETSSLLVGNGGVISSATFGSGKAGDMIVRANSVEAFGTLNNLNASGLFTAAQFGSTGNAGDLTIATQHLRLTDGAQILATTTGAGNGGNLRIKATEAVEVSGFAEFRNPGLPIPLSIAGSTIASSVSRRQVMGNAGNVTIETRRLTVKDGGQIITATFGAGKGGNLTIRAMDSVELIGTSGTNPPVVNSLSGRVTSLAATAGRNSTGNAGTLTIETRQLTIRDGARATVENLATIGQAGDLVVKADSIRLLDGGSLDAETRAGDRGNITIDAKDILLSNNSRITTNAQQTASGGNITINTNTLVAVPKEDSDITANAQKGSGGRVSITAQGIFGTQFRDQLTPLSDITATSDLGSEFKGTVQIDIQGVDPNRGLVELPVTVADSSNQIAQTCASQARNNSFVMTGRGGLPPTPSEALNYTPGWIDWRVSRSGQDEEIGGTAESSTQQSKIPNPLVEATGWLINTQGQVELVANVSSITSQNSWYKPVTCADTPTGGS